MDIAEVIWGKTTHWDYFAKDTIGKQFVRAVDSIAANLSEGHGRYHYKENKQFCHYARGSADESLTWLEKSVRRNLIDRNEGKDLYQRLETLKKRINAYIKSIGVDSKTND